MYGNIAELFPHYRNPPKVMTVQVLGISVYGDGEEHDITINSSNIDCLVVLSCSMRNIK